MIYVIFARAKIAWGQARGRLDHRFRQPEIAVGNERITAILVVGSEDLMSGRHS
jgi:hypothetical protein